MTTVLFGFALGMLAIIATGVGLIGPREYNHATDGPGRHRPERRES